MKELLLFISLPLAVTLLSFYVINIASLHKALKSISNSDYWLKKPWKFTFELTMGVLGSILLFYGLEMRENNIVFLVIAGIGIIGVGVFARFKKNMFMYISHQICAYIGFSATILSIGFSFGMWWLLPVPIIAGLCTLFNRKDMNTLIWYIEMNLIHTTFPIIYVLIITELLKSL